MTQKLVPLSSLFNVSYGLSLDLNKLEQCDKHAENSINYVSRTRENNGVSARVKLIPDIEPASAGTISVAGSGDSVLYAFLQPEPYYSGYHLFTLEAKIPLTDGEKLFYCYCLYLNRYRFNFGRQANRTLGTLLVPAKVPEWVKNNSVPDYADLNLPYHQKQVDLSSRTFCEFRLDELFTVEKGQRIVNRDMIEGDIPCIRPISLNNGTYAYIDIEPNHQGNTISINYNGSVGEAFYQPIPYFALDDINILYPKFFMNVYIAMFIIGVIRKESYRFHYGRKWNLARMEATTIKLPIKDNNSPDWLLMENYIKSLPYSKAIEL